MSASESGVRWYVAHNGIVTDPTEYTSDPDAPRLTPDPEDERQARLAASGNLRPVPRPTPPAPGTGTIFISPIEGEWYALWESVEGPNDVRTLEGPSGMTREQAIAWAFGLAAEGVMIHDGEDWVPVRRGSVV